MSRLAGRLAALGGEQEGEVGAELADGGVDGSTEPAERESMTSPSMVVRTKVART